MASVTGYQIREAIKSATEDLAQVTREFESSLYYFKSDDTVPPELKTMGKTALELEEKIVMLQELLVKFNLFTQVNILSYGDLHSISLLHAIKMLGGSNRCEKLWKQAANPQERSRLGGFLHTSGTTTRSKDIEVAERSISVEEASLVAKEHRKVSSALKMAIAVGNGQPFEVEDEEFQRLFT